MKNSKVSSSGEAWAEPKPSNGFPIAKELGLMATSTTYEGSIVSKAWCTSAGEGGGFSMVGDEVQELVINETDAQERYKRVAGLDEACFGGLKQIVTGIAGPDQWKEMLMIDGEQEVVALPFAGVSGMPATPSETFVGQGLLLLTRFKDGKHRLHFAIKCDRASMEADEAWGEREEGCLCCQKVLHDVSASYQSKHGQDTFFSVINLENNLFHCHSQMEDESTLAAAFGGKSAPNKDCCEECCKCACCGPCCGPCCDCPKNTETAGIWSNRAKFAASLRAYTDRIVEEGSNPMTHKFPGIAAVTHPQQHAMQTSQLHALHLVYRDTATNSVRPCIVVVSPSLPIPTIGKFASWLSTLVTADPEPARSGAWGLGSLSKGGGGGGGGGGAISSGGDKIGAGEIAGNLVTCGAAWFPPIPALGCWKITSNGPDEFQLKGSVHPPCFLCGCPVKETYQRKEGNKFILVDTSGKQKCCGTADLERDGGKIKIFLADYGGYACGQIKG